MMTEGLIPDKFEYFMIKNYNAKVNAPQNDLNIAAPKFQ